MSQAPKEKPAAAAGEAPPAKSKKKLIVIIAAVVLLAGIGGGAWFFMHAKDADKKEAAHKEEKHEGPEHAPVFVPIETFTVNLQPDPNEKFLQTDISMQVASPEAAEKIKALMPAIKSRILLLLTSKQASEIATSEGKQALSDELLAELKKPFTEHGKPEEITGIFFTSFVIQ